MLNAKLILILNFIHKNGDGRNLVAIFANAIFANYEL